MKGSTYTVVVYVELVLVGTYSVGVRDVGINLGNFFNGCRGGLTQPLGHFAAGPDGPLHPPICFRCFNFPPSNMLGRVSAPYGWSCYGLFLFNGCECNDKVIHSRYISPNLVIISSGTRIHLVPVLLLWGSLCWY